MYKQVLLLSFGCAASLLFYAQTNSNAGGGKTIVLTNHSKIALKDKAVTIKRKLFPGIADGHKYPLIMSGTDTIPSQLDDLNGDNKWDELFFVADLEPGQTRTFSIKWVNEPPVYVKRTAVNFSKRYAADIPLKPATSETLYAKELPRSLGFQRYQTDGPSWENDKVGFRHYLDGRNAKDVFGKLVPYMALENVGINAKGEVEDNYHKMEKWGRDILAVSNSVGIGGVALLKGDELLRLGVTVEDKVNNVEKTSFKIVSNGPVRSIMNFSYHNWNPAGENYQAQEETSIWPGMYAYNNTVKFSGLKHNEKLGIGLVNLNAEKKLTELRINDKWVALVSHERHSYNKEWWLGLALLVPASNYLGMMDAPNTGQLSNSWFAKIKITDGQPVNYFAIACWELSDSRFADPVYFQQYVVDLAQQISASVKVVVK